MRSTVLMNLECKRLVPYDADDHTILERGGEIKYRAESIEDSRLVIEIDFTYEVRTRDGKLWGTIKGKARSTITDSSIKAVATGKETPELSEAMVLVIDGAVSDDVLLPVSEVAKAMRLPGLLMGPRASPEQHAARAPQQSLDQAAAKP